MSEEEKEKMIPVPASRWADLVISARKGDMTRDLIDMILAGINAGSIKIEPSAKSRLLSLISRIQSYEPSKPKA